MKHFFSYLLVLLLLTGCATAKKINRVSIGMSKSQVIQLMGRPSSTSAKGNIEYLIYKLSETDDHAWYGIYTDYFVKLINGHVDSYGKLGDFDSTKDPTINVNTNSKIETNQTNNSESESDKMYTELKKLKELLDKGIITQEEFDKKKKDILDKYK
jgi:outer membrane protein assembly factor BamE (lipoprotein component of BamABCDE complex)